MAKTSWYSFTQSRQDLDRISHILNILVKFQLGQVANRLRRGEKLPVRLKVIQKCPPDIECKPREERIRIMVEELGTTFVKFGQLLSTRADVIGEEYATELAKLQDDMKPFPTEKAKQIVREELGKPVKELFSSFESEPLASASIAQVHRATLKNGKKVVVKIQRPGIEETVKEDMRLMHYLAYLVNKHIPDLRKYDPKYLVNEFERSILKELDFTREAKNAQRLKENFKDEEGIYVPIIYEDLSTRRVLTMEEIDGTRLSDLISSKSKACDRTLIAKRCVQAFFKMVLVDGFYHADLHPGNIMVMDRDVICFLDFGHVGTIDKEQAENIFRLTLFAVNDDVSGLIAHLIRTNIISETGNMNEFKADMADLLDTYYSKDVKDVKMGHLLTDLMDVIGKYEFNRPRELAELARALFILEGVGEQLDPKFNIAEEFAPYAKEVLPAGFNIQRLASIISNDVLDLEYIAKVFPGAFRKFLRKIEEGKIKFELEHKNLEVFSTELRSVSNKLSISLVVAAAIIGSSIIVNANRTLGLAIFVISSVLGLWFVLKTLL